MKLGYKNDNLSHNLFKKFSLKSKLIIFCILSLVVLGIAYKTKLENKNIDINKSTTENTKINKSNSDALIKVDSSNQKDKAKINTEQEEKNNMLELKYEEGAKAFSDKKYIDTINIADAILKDDENFYKAYNIKGIALCYNKDFEEGMKNIDKALQLKSDFGYARFNKALAYELYGHYDEALVWYDKALEVENYIWSYYGKASIYGRRGDVDNTVKYLKIAIGMSPEIKKIASVEADFGSVKDSKEFQDLIK